MRFSKKLETLTSIIFLKRLKVLAYHNFIFFSLCYCSLNIVPLEIVTPYSHINLFVLWPNSFNASYEFDIII